MSRDDAGQWRWQAPPGWPPPPESWSPPPGWSPDPTWPQPPPGWVWWRVEPRRQQGLSTGLLVTLAVAAGVVVPAVAIGLVATLMSMGGPPTRACDIVDPATGAAAQVDLVNDSSDPVFLDECEGQGCLLAETTYRVSPDDDVVVGLACTTSHTSTTSWRIRDVDFRAQGYLVVKATVDADGTTYYVTDASPDRTTPTVGD